MDHMNDEDATAVMCSEKHQQTMLSCPARLAAPNIYNPPIYVDDEGDNSRTHGFIIANGVQDCKYWGTSR